MQYNYGDWIPVSCMCGTISSGIDCSSNSVYIFWFCNIVLNTMDVGQQKTRSNKWCITKIRLSFGVFDAWYGKWPSTAISPPAFDGFTSISLLLIAVESRKLKKKNTSNVRLHLENTKLFDWTTMPVHSFWTPKPTEVAKTWMLRITTDICLIWFPHIPHPKNLYSTTRRSCEIRTR